MRSHLLQMITLLSSFLALAWPALAQNVPQTISHQGYVEVNGTPFDGTGNFRFALVDSAGNNVWTQDNTQLGTSNMPDTAQAIPVTNGIYAAALGAATAIPDNVLSNTADLKLRVWFDDGSNGVQQLTPDKPLESAPYARVAGTVVNVPAEITVDKVNYSTPRTKYLSLKGADFLSSPQESNNHASANINGLVADPEVSFFAPVHLPDGAQLTSMTLYFDDQDSDSEVEARIRANDMTRNTVTFPASVDTSDVTGEGSNVTTGSPLLVFDNSINHYQVELHDLSNDWDNCNIQGVVLEYELSEAP